MRTTEAQADRAELRTDFADLKTTVAERLEDQTRHLMFGMIGSMATIAGIAFGAASLG